MDDTREALKPCPFCGGPGKLLFSHEIGSKDAYTVECAACEFELVGPITHHTQAAKTAATLVWNARTPDPLVTELVEALAEGRRAIGDHFAPNDCYATGPLTGDTFRDLVQCPACSFIAMYDAAIAKAQAQHPSMPGAAEGEGR